VFGEERAAEGAALASRAPLDLRVNDIKGERDEAAALLADLNPVPTRWSPVRAADRARGRCQESGDPCRARVHQGHGGGAGRGLAARRALLAGAKAGRARGRSRAPAAGGKTLALAAAMHNQGQLYAPTTDKRRLAPIHEAARACSGVRNVQVRTAEIRRYRARRSRRPR
jgi:16S rRNA (cytosine967-C5)-methyltransferase